MISAKLTLEHLYDKYGAMLYSIALEISPSPKEAEVILIGTFKKIYAKNLVFNNSPSWGIKLIKGLLATARKNYFVQLNNNCSLERFENTPLVNEIICRQKGISNFCDVNRISISDARKQLRLELASLSVS